MRRLNLLILILTCVGFFSACSVSDRVVLEDSEGAVPKDFFNTVKKNKTKKEWVLEQLGPAHTRDSYSENIEALTYYFQRTRYRRTSILLLLSFNGSQVQHKNYHVLVCDGLVKKAWFDALENVDVARQAKNMRCVTKATVENMGYLQEGK